MVPPAIPPKAVSIQEKHRRGGNSGRHGMGCDAVDLLCQRVGSPDELIHVPILAHIGCGSRIRVNATRVAALLNGRQTSVNFGTVYLVGAAFWPIAWRNIVRTGHVRLLTIGAKKPDCGPCALAARHLCSKFNGPISEVERLPLNHGRSIIIAPL
jgi:hypothetical protein